MTVITVDESCDYVAESSDSAVKPWMGAVTVTFLSQAKLQRWIPWTSAATNLLSQTKPWRQNSVDECCDCVAESSDLNVPDENSPEKAYEVSCM